MPEVQAFRGFRYDLGRVGNLSDVIAPPYDVIDPALQQRLYERKLESFRPHLDCAWIHAERSKPGVTLQLLHHHGYLEANPGGYQYTRFCHHYRE